MFGHIANRRTSPGVSVDVSMGIGLQVATLRRNRPVVDANKLIEPLHRCRRGALMQSCYQNDGCGEI
jgi:hypothetical protein